MHPGYCSLVWFGELALVGCIQGLFTRCLSEQMTHRLLISSSLRRIIVMLVVQRRLSNETPKAEKNTYFSQGCESIPTESETFLSNLRY